MKKLVLILSFLFFGMIGINAQNKSFVASDTIAVRGVCSMCKERIEAALDVQGVKYASYNPETQMLVVKYLPSKISNLEIHQLCANVGHATQKLPANKEAYSNLHGCCKYETIAPHK